MVSGNPPRHSKSGKEPVTIELEANTQAADEAQELASRASVTDEPDDISASEPLSEQGPAQSEPTSNAAAAAFGEEPVAAASPEQKPRTSASTSGALAAGIVGGLIALATAGGLQYAGLLPSPGPSSSAGTNQQALETEIAAIKAQLAETPAAQGSVNLAPLEQRLSDVEKTLAAAPAAGGAITDISGLEATIATLTAELDTVKGALAETGKQQDAARSELDQRLDAAEQKLNEPSNDAKMARAVAATALKTAIERGGPFLAELDALASVAPEDAAVAGLRDDAATGVPSRADIARSFPDTANAMLDAVDDTGAETGVFNRLMNSASSLVRVRPVGNIAGEEPDAVIARIEDKIVNGDLKGASLEWEALPEKAKTAGAAFKTTLDKRIKAENLVGASVSGAMSSGNQG